MTRFVHVTRVPPSPSGVALFARDMDLAYSALGTVEVHALPAQPEASQSLLLAVRTAWRLHRTAPRHAADTVLAFELAGRGVAETWAAWLLVRRGRRAWLTVHDAPTVSGSPCMTRALDRRGLRRLGTFLSRTVGRAMERDLLERAERVLTLSASGADALARTYDLRREVESMPHVLAPAAGSSEPRIFVPGYLGEADDLFPLIDLLPSLPAEWHLAVGAGSPATLAAAQERAAHAGVPDRVHLLGFQDEEALDREFTRAAVVVRWRAAGWAANGAGRFAVSGPVVRALGRGCAVVTNDDRGVRDCLGAAGAVVVDGGDAGAAQLAAAVSVLVANDAWRAERAAAGLAHTRDSHAPEAVARHLAGRSSAERYPEKTGART